MNIRPLVSVIMPVYNCELYIKEAVNSILNQTYHNFELLIIDDASIDSTLKIIKEFNDSRIKIIEKSCNSGYTNSLNLGIKLVNGKYIARMDGDDISIPERFEKQVRLLEKNEEVILCGGWFKIIESEKVIRLPENNNDIKSYLLRGNCIAHPSVMLRKEALEGMDIVYDLTKEPAEDYDLWTRLMFKGAFNNIQEVLIEYRTHANQVSKKRNELQQKNDFVIKRNLYNTLDFCFTEEENIVFNNLLNHGNGITIKDYLVFKKVQTKLLVSNSANVFEKESFKKEILHLDKVFVKSCFLKAKQYNPKTIINYLKIKKQSCYRLTQQDEFKLLIKSLLFFKPK